MKSSIKQCSLLVLSSLITFSVYAQQGPVKGESSAGTYPNIGALVTGADAVSNTGLNGLKVVNYPSVFNGTTWDRLRGTTDGLKVIPSVGTLTDNSGTITTASTSQQVMAVNANRRYLYIQNNSDTVMWCNFTAAAVLGQPSFQLAAGATFIMENGAVSTEAVNCIGSLAAKSYTAKQM